jgi:hypothetical protein
VTEESKPAPPTIRPVDSDGVAVISAGTGAWLVALIVLVVLHKRLSDDGHLWWIAVAAIGVGLGLLGIGYCVRLRRRNHA